ncbi:hypothetical protein KUTeg_017227 [Tegillarca granosa]|uniref:Uncharacterized protein n=1 Tax=Tegillarca granosa TaxID=220873 RepID=A0ABQ9ED20_TEGGR|nr:hypothetical protein KUTeg_020708 [Tegillarca granosa]KAJ8305220.1 hypothetical protein KUTeg_017227 [Tegillarca granosa]
MSSEFREKLYKSAIFSCAIETFPNIISNVMETDLTTQEIDNRKITSSTEILRVYANHVLHFCTNAEKFIECVHETVPVSNNTMDRILIELMDFSRKDNLVQITANVCREILGDIKSNINCIIPEDQTCTGIPNFPRCFNRANHTLRSAFEDTILSTDINGNAVRATFCKPVEEMMSCATENIKSCNPSVALHVNDFMKILLITDCKEKVKNSASNYKLKNVWTTVFIAMMLLLIVIHPV